MLVEWITIGGIFFWILTAIVGLVIISTVANERGTVSTLVAAAYIAALVLLGNFSPIAWVLANPLQTAFIAGGYYIAGVVYTYFKWFRFCVSKKRDYLARKREFLNSNGITGDEIPDHLRRHFGQTATAPQVRHHKSTILMWLTYWPFSLAGTFVADLIHNVFIGLYNHIAGSLQRVSDNVWKNVQ